MRIQSILMTFFGSALLTGCASMFGIGTSSPACPGGQGVGCVSARQAYSMSNNSSAVEAAEAAGSGQGNRRSSLDPEPVSAIQVSLPEPIQQPMPVMEPAKIMRLWINTWQDDRNQLHFPSIVFAEVTPRRWSMGNNAAISEARVLTPYRIEANAKSNASLVTSGPGGGRPTPARVAPSTPQSSPLPTQDTSR